MRNFPQVPFFCIFAPQRICVAKHNAPCAAEWSGVRTGVAVWVGTHMCAKSGCPSFCVRRGRGARTGFCRMTWNAYAGKSKLPALLLWRRASGNRTRSCPYAAEIICAQADMHSYYMKGDAPVSGCIVPNAYVACHTCFIFHEK